MPKRRGYRGKRHFTEINYSKRAKIRGYRGKRQLTAINHSKKPQTSVNRGIKKFTAINHSKKHKTRGKKQSTAIIHSKKYKTRDHALRLLAIIRDKRSIRWLQNSGRDKRESNAVEMYDDEICK
jgi:thymidylate synthase